MLYEVITDSTFLGTLHEIVMRRPDAVKVQRLPSKIRALFEELSMEGVLNHCTIVITSYSIHYTKLYEITGDPTAPGMGLVSFDAAGEPLLRAPEASLFVSAEARLPLGAITVPVLVSYFV